jgi:hypothetical protein
LGVQYLWNIKQKHTIGFGPNFTWRIPNFDGDKSYINLSTVSLKVGYFI